MHPSVAITTRPKDARQREVAARRLRCQPACAQRNHRFRRRVESAGSRSSLVREDGAAAAKPRGGAATPRCNSLKRVALQLQGTTHSHISVALLLLVRTSVATETSLPTRCTRTVVNKCSSGNSGTGPVRCVEEREMHSGKATKGWNFPAAVSRQCICELALVSATRSDSQGTYTRTPRVTLANVASKI